MTSTHHFCLLYSAVVDTPVVNMSWQWQKPWMPLAYNPTRMWLARQQKSTSWHLIVSCDNSSLLFTTLSDLKCSSLVPEGGPVCVTLSPGSECFLSCRHPMCLRNRRYSLRSMGTFPTGGLKGVPPIPACTSLHVMGALEYLMVWNIPGVVQVKIVVKVRGQHIANRTYTGAQTIVHW